MADTTGTTISALQTRVKNEASLNPPEVKSSSSQRHGEDDLPCSRHVKWGRSNVETYSGTCICPTRELAIQNLEALNEMERKLESLQSGQFLNRQ
ncbi:hypothetical protein Ancab_014442 [Ancistrocladus abbreviatus]